MLGVSKGWTFGGHGQKQGPHFIVVLATGYADSIIERVSTTLGQISEFTA